MVITEMENWFASKSAVFYQNDITGLFHSCKKCMATGGQYVEMEQSVNGLNFRSLTYLDHTEGKFNSYTVKAIKKF